jgi:hypothetical protein
VAKPLDLGHPVAESVAYIQDNGVFLTAACFHGLMEDFPGLRITMAHSGASMVPLVLEKAETYLWLTGSMGNTAPVSLEPEEVLAKHPFVTTFDSWEASVARMPDAFVGIAGWGSRYPHHDAADPAAAVQMLQEHGVERLSIERLMGGNAIELFGLKVKASA